MVHKTRVRPPDLLWSPTVCLLMYHVHVSRQQHTDAVAKFYSWLFCLSVGVMQARVRQRQIRRCSTCPVDAAAAADWRLQLSTSFINSRHLQRPMTSYAFRSPFVFSFCCPWLTRLAAMRRWIRNWKTAGSILSRSAYTSATVSNAFTRMCLYIVNIELLE